MTVATAGTRFVHLHTHSEYSPIDSLLKIKDLVRAAAADGNPALAVTDHGTHAGIWKLGQYAREAGIKPIAGIEAYLSIGARAEHNFIEVDHDDDDPDIDGVRGKKSKKYEHLTLLASTSTGWANLVAMGNESQDSFWLKPRIDYELLAKYGEGIIVLTGCLGGPVAGPLSRGNRDEAIANLHTLIGCVGKDNVYVEVMDHGIEAQILIMDELRAVAAEVGLPLVATNDSHYMLATDKDAHEAWLAVGTKKVQSDAERFRFHGSGHHLRTGAEVRALQGGADWWLEACDNTLIIADRIAPDVLPVPHLRLPVFPCPDGFVDSATYLKHLVREGAFERYGADPERPGKLPAAVNDRLKFEFPVIFNAGIADYFLIVWDLIAWARSDRGYPTAAFPDGEPGKKVPIRVGAGRGSAAGSVVSFCLSIVGVDPLANHLLFERFLNPDRTGMPDIDVDFEQGRRQEVLRYIERKYGRDKVARIGTFGVAATRRAILDASKFLGQAPLGARLSPLVPIGAGGKPISLTALADVTDQAGDAFRSALGAAGPAGFDVMTLARSFEGVTKLEGIHACGTLISDEPMARLAPMRRDRAKAATDEDLLVTVWDGKDTESYGFLKMDILGLRNLDIISAAVRFIQADTGECIDADGLIPGNPNDAVRDAKTWELIGSGRTAGVFQLESSGMTALAENVAPSSLNDLTALVALYRPGPMSAKMHEHYAARKNSHEPVDYNYLTTDPAEQAAIASVLGDTFGTIVYQEQIMRLGGVVGGLTPGMRNKLQKAFSKKNVAMMAEVKEAMFAGGLAGAGTCGVAFRSETLDRIWVAFEGSAAYLFNQSHACAYGFISYQTAYLKANWPVQYGAAILASTDKDDKRLLAIRSLQVEGIEIKAPDINLSGTGTAPDGDFVRLGLSEVKGVGKNASHIVAERDANGPFTSLADAMARVRIPGKPTATGVEQLGPIQVNTMEALVEAGAFDAFGPRLGQSMILRAARAVPEMAPFDAEWGVLERSARQRLRLGVSTGPHPLVVLKDQIAAIPRGGQTLAPVQAVEHSRDGQRITLLAVLAGWTEKAYKRGRMVTMTLEGSKGSVEGVMWDEDRARLPAVPVTGDLVIVSAQVRVRQVEVERLDEEGETVIDSFERRDVTVKTVLQVPVQDPSRMVLAPMGELVVPEPAQGSLALDEAPEPVVQLALGTGGPDEQDAPPADPGESTAEPQWVGYDWAPDDEPPADPDFEPAPEHDRAEADATIHLAPVRALSVVAAPPGPEVVRVDGLILGAGNPVVRQAIRDFGVPAGFCEPAGGAWSLTTGTGQHLVVLTGAREVPGAAHLPGKAVAGWTALSLPQTAAA
jgi:DNA polymerase-3 subunit alpha